MRSAIDAEIHRCTTRIGVLANGGGVETEAMEKNREEQTEIEKLHNNTAQLRLQLACEKLKVGKLQKEIDRLRKAEPTG